jgi:hypothetical protein
MNIGLTISPYNPLYKQVSEALEKAGHSVYGISTWLTEELVVLATKQCQALVVDFSEPTGDQFVNYRLPHLEFMCLNSGVAMGIMLGRKLPIILFDSKYANFTDKLLLGETVDSRGAVCDSPQLLVGSLPAAATAFDKHKDYDVFLRDLRAGFAIQQPDKKSTLPAGTAKAYDYVLICDPKTKSMAALEAALVARGNTVHVINDAVSNYPLNLAAWEPVRDAKMVITSVPADSEAMTHLVQRSMLLGLATELHKPTVGLWCMSDNQSSSDSVGMHYEYTVEGMVGLGITAKSADPADVATILAKCDDYLNGMGSSDYSKVVPAIVSSTRPKDPDP